MTKKTPQERLESARFTEGCYLEVLQAAAIAYAEHRDDATTQALTEAAKKWTNANHATGRARKAVS